MYRPAPQDQSGASRNLLDVLAASKDEELASDSLIVVLGGKSMMESTAADDQFRLMDLVSSEGTEGQVPSQQEKELLEPPSQPVSKPRKYFHTHYSKEQIKLGASLQREQQKKKAEDMLHQEAEPELMQEEIDEKTRKEQVKQERAQRYTR